MINKILIGFALLFMVQCVNAEWVRNVETDDFTKKSIYSLQSKDLNNLVEIRVFKNEEYGIQRIDLQSDSFEFLSYEGAVKLIDIKIDDTVYANVQLNVGDMLSGLLGLSTGIKKVNSGYILLSRKLLQGMRAGNIMSIRIDGNIYKFDLKGFTKASRGM